MVHAILLLTTISCAGLYYNQQVLENLSCVLLNWKRKQNPVGFFFEGCNPKHVFLGVDLMELRNIHGLAKASATLAGDFVGPFPR